MLNCCVLNMVYPLIENQPLIEMTYCTYSCSIDNIHLHELISLRDSFASVDKPNTFQSPGMSSKEYNKVSWAEILLFNGVAFS